MYIGIGIDRTHKVSLRTHPEHLVTSATMASEEVATVTTGQPHLAKQDLSKLVSYFL